jgi:hypothetical protein
MFGVMIQNDFYVLGGESTDFSTDFRGISLEKNIVPGVSIFCFTLSCSQYN